MKTEVFANKIRKISWRMVFNANASHIGSAFSIADIVAVLYNEFLNLDKNNFDKTSRDRFILSKGHACVSIYAALNIKEIISDEIIDTYAMDNSDLMSHISHKVNGVEFSTGSLGHGLSFALGKAIALKLANSDSKVVVLVGDGEMQEGAIWEALMFASFHKLDNLTLIIDNNNLQSLTTVEETLSLSPLFDKITSFGWNAIEIDGHNIKDIRTALNVITRKPKCIIAKTIKGKGIDFMENKVEWHYKSPNVEQYENGLKQLNFEKYIY